MPGAKSQLLSGAGLDRTAEGERVETFDRGPRSHLGVARGAVEDGAERPDVARLDAVQPTVADGGHGPPGFCTKED